MIFSCGSVNPSKLICPFFTNVLCELNSQHSPYTTFGTINLFYVERFIPSITCLISSSVYSGPGGGLCCGWPFCATVMHFDSLDLLLH